MSKESSTWLNQNVLIGNTATRGSAWHYRASDQGDEPNHYAGPVPTEDVRRRLFNWEPIKLPVYVRVPATIIDQVDGLDADGQPYRMVPRPGRVNIARSDTFADLGMFRPSYEPHNYGAVLLDNVGNILDGELGISSAGLLRGGAVAWVEVSVPESITTPSGVEFRPNLVAATSCDGSLSTTYKRTIGAVVCDNTLSAALGEGGRTVKVMHSKYSQLKIDSARDALEIVYSTADEFAAEVERLCNTKVTNEQWDLVLREIIPDGQSSAGVTRAANRRHEIEKLWNHDLRVAPWKGTAFGAIQAFNTYRHHEAKANVGTVRAERNMLHAIDGTTDREDLAVLRALVTAGALS